MSTFRDYRVVESRCPRCDYKLDAAATVTGEESPTEGDWSVCLNCGQVLRYESDLKLRSVTPEDIAELVQDRKTWDVIHKAVRIIQRRGRFAGNSELIM